jgi:hypothetical protein
MVAAMDDAEKIAAGLTEAQINLLFYWPKGLFSTATYRALHSKGLIESRSVTAKGEAVKAVILERSGT